QEGILGAELSPALYAYTQTFKDQGQDVVRKGILALVKLSELGKGEIYPHEHTLKGPIKDRFSLMSATMANMSPVFMLYEDESRTLEQGSWYNSEAAGWQTVEIPEESGVKHAIRPITDAAMIEKAQ